MLCLLKIIDIINANSKERIGIMSKAKNQKNINAQSAEKAVEAVAKEEKAAVEIEEIKEFVVSSEKTRSERKKAEQASISAIAAWSDQKKSIAVIILFAAVALAYILVGILACEINPVVVCVILLIQVAIGVLLDQNPVWLHACVAAANVVVGICVGQTLLMVAAVVVYVAAIVALEMLQRMGMLGRA